MLSTEGAPGPELSLNKQETRGAEGLLEREQEVCGWVAVRPGRPRVDTVPLAAGAVRPSQHFPGKRRRLLLRQVVLPVQAWPGALLPTLCHSGWVWITSFILPGAMFRSDQEWRSRWPAEAWAQHLPCVCSCLRRWPACAFPPLTFVHKSRLNSSWMTLDYSVPY